MIIKRSAFTLVEILIVVIILGILAAIVIPQFTQASNDARTNALATDLQSLRGQLQLYRLQHLDTIPTADNLATVLTTRTNQSGATGADANLYPCGPYLMKFPTNAFAGNNFVATGGTPGNGSTAGWWYDPSTGSINANDSAHAGL